MTAKSYLSYPNKLIDQYNDTYIILLVKKLLMLTIVFWLKKVRRIRKLLSLKLKIKIKLNDKDKW